MAKVIRDTPDEPIPYLIKTLKKIYSEQESKVTHPAPPSAAPLFYGEC